METTMIKRMIKRSISKFLAIILILGSVAPAGLAQQQGDTKVVTTPPTSVAQGTSKIEPAKGSEGTGATYNFLPYSLPGQYPNPLTQQIENQPFDISYASRKQPVQTSDWWTGIGLQWSNDDHTVGWVIGRSDAEGKAGRSRGFIAEPFSMSFVDYGVSPANQILGMNPNPAGLRLWSPNKFSVQNKGTSVPDDKFNASNNYSGYGNVAEPSPVVTVGLAGVHPLGTEVRTQAPWSNVKVQSYSDWGSVVSYADTPGEMTVTMAAGSPFVWFERTKGAAAFQVWAGDPKPAEGGGLSVWYNNGNVLGITVSTVYVPFMSLPTVGSSASYVIYADQGSWSEQKASNGVPVSLLTNAAATRAAVLALPHNIDPANTAALIAAKDDLGKYATVKITDTRLHYPPVAGSDASVTLSNGQTLPLGFDEKNAVIRSKLQVTTAAFPINGFSGATPLQLVFPHHRKAMIADSQKNILGGVGAPQYVWNGVIGQYFAYAGASYVRELANPGGLPFLPGVGMNSTLQNPLQAGQSAADDVYQTMKTWFFVEEPVLPGGKDKNGKDIPANIGSFARNLGTYVNVQTNTYIQGISGVYEMLNVAEQLSRAPSLAVQDTDFGKTKQQVAAEMRDYMLQTLKEMVGQWADVYTAQFFWYNSQYNSLFGFPQGFGSIQNFNDHHFHYGYFLRAAAAIGRYDKDWLTKYLPFIDEIRRDVATYDRGDTQYPFLREFSPFYGHNWADGTGQDGQNQESVSEAMNIAYGMIELGQLAGDKNLRDLGVYMFAEEELAAQQYWFNSDANLANSTGTPYNGNWPDALVHYTGPDGGQWKTTLITNVKQFGVFRSTFFGGIAGAYTIQQTPMTAYALFFGRNQNWLKETWKQYLLDSGGAPQGPYETIVAAIQSQLPQSGTTLNDVGLTPALNRISATHNFFPGAPNSHAKHWAYSLAALGQIDYGVVADTTSYAVFNNNGQRTYTAYNPGATDITVTFTDKTSGAKTTLQVPAGTMASKAPAGADNLDRVTSYAPDSRRLYLRNGGALSTTPGTWTLPQGQTAFPTDLSALSGNLTQVPVRSDQTNAAPQPITQTPIVPPSASDIRAWTTTFSGKLVGDPLQQVTRFALYTNQALFPGWQQDPSVAGNTVTVRFVYDFNSDGTPDRVEVLQNAPLSSGNAFQYESKLTEYTGDRLFNGPIGRGNVFIGALVNGVIGYNAPYPSEVTNGTLTVQFYGGSNPNTVLLHPYFVSQDASPLTNRASWVKPPYVTDPTQVDPGPAKPECATICFASPDYYLRNLNRLPAGTVWIAGGGVVSSVDSGNAGAMRRALGGGASAQDQFNRQYVAAQLSLLSAPGPDLGALGSRLSCYGLNFAPVVLGSGATITPNVTLGVLMEYARGAALRGVPGDQAALTELLTQVNAQCRR
jgi:hypothetical protein